MAIITPVGFEIQGPEPVDTRYVKETIADRDALPPVLRYEGLPVYVKETGRTYTLVEGIDNSNWKDLGGGGAAEWGKITGDISLQTDLYGEFVELKGDIMSGDLEIRRPSGISGATLKLGVEGASSNWGLFSSDNIFGLGTAFAIGNYSGGSLQGYPFLIRPGAKTLRGSYLGWYIDGSRIFTESEHIDFSNGVVDRGKPIVLNSQGKVDESMISVSALYPVGTHNPSGGTEYPDTTNETPGAFWIVDGLTAEYIFTSGPLAGKPTNNGDMMVLAENDNWILMSLNMDPNTYYKLDGSNAITAPFSGGGQQFKSAADASDSTDLVTLQQLQQNTRLNFISLDDTPQDYIGHHGKVVAVNSAATGLEFIDMEQATLQIVQAPPYNGIAGDDRFVIPNAATGEIVETLSVTVGSVFQTRDQYTIETTNVSRDTILLATPLEEDAEVIIEYFKTLPNLPITGAVERFTDLLDTPASYEKDDAGKLVRVKYDTSGLEFVEPLFTNIQREVFQGNTGDINFTVNSRIIGTHAVLVGGSYQIYGTDFTIVDGNELSDTIHFNEALDAPAEVIIEYYSNN